MKLRGVSHDHPRFTILWEALKKSLVERPHRDPCWADIGECEYYYVHDAHHRVINSTETSTANSGKAAGKGLSNVCIAGHLI